ncbi:unnamed protein product [Parnassius apollo]|uniref:(apollo) hypothetical protein n=1 Tax=Parnassius apollo TaxID=110799 RepID=A0A8S3XBG1_PARAO|nr:unnamed protein product [Parnassius apollo]
MTSVENIPSVNNDSEMEEGEIVDDMDDLSDISSEEEFLLRQRLQVLENYNNVLERKKAKRASISQGDHERRTEILLHDLSEISATDFEDNVPVNDFKYQKDQTYPKSNHRPKKANLHNGHGKGRDYKKKSHRKRRLEVKVVSESSEESDDEYRNKRRKLANAVTFNKVKGDTSSLKARLNKMLCGSNNKEYISVENIEISNMVENLIDDYSVEKNEENNSVKNIEENNSQTKDSDNIIEIDCQENIDTTQLEKDKEKAQSPCDLIDLCSEDSKEMEKPVTEMRTQDVVDSNIKENIEVIEGNKNNKQDSDDELEVLRQHALKTKSLKSKPDIPEVSAAAQNKPTSEDDDSDTAELRLICLKSAFLKKAIEMKFKQKLRKRLKTKSTSLQDDFMINHEELGNVTDVENNTDIESVDMDIGSDGDDKAKELPVDRDEHTEQKPLSDISKTVTTSNISKEDEFEEDEDLLRAKLLISLSKNLPNLVGVVNKIDNSKSIEKSSATPQVKQNVSEEKKFIINLGDSDSEGEHEATKNLTKMHMKLSEQVDFQQKLDLFLKSTRKKVESAKLPDVVQQPSITKPHVKYVAKAVNHLPKSEQIEYKNLVKRMAELEKIKQARQSSTMSQNNTSVLKETLKPRNVAVENTNLPSNSLEEKIAESRKNIAVESAKMLKLKEEGTKLLQKYKIVATELRNISTAITLNKKEQRTVQNKLSRIRAQHQMLLKSSNFKHSTGGLLVNQTNNKIIANKLQKENNPTKDDHKVSTMLKAVKVSFVNDLSKENTGLDSKLSVQVDIKSNKKIVKLPKSPEKERIVNLVGKTDNNERIEAVASEEKSTGVEEIPKTCSSDHEKKDNGVNDYRSPLEAFGTTTNFVNKHITWIELCVRTSPLSTAIWKEDPNAFLCPYEVGGSCRDTDCKFLHPKIPSHQ